MTVRLSTAQRESLRDALKTDLEGGSAKIYTGTQPASGDDDVSGTLLATLTYSSAGFSTPTSVSLSVAATATDVEAGEAGWIRVFDSSGVARMDADVGEGSGSVNLDDKTFVAGGTVEVTLTFSVPETC